MFSKISNSIQKFAGKRHTRLWAQVVVTVLTFLLLLMTYYMPIFVTFSSSHPVGYFFDFGLGYYSLVYLGALPAIFFIWTNRPYLCLITSICYMILLICAPLTEQWNTLLQESAESSYYTRTGNTSGYVVLWVIVAALTITILIAQIWPKKQIQKTKRRNQPHVNLQFAAEELKQFQKLMKIGAITQEEFQTQKEQLLGLNQEGGLS